MNGQVAARSIAITALGVSLVGVGIALKQYPLLDPIANISFPYLAGIVGLAILVVGVHCILFGSTIPELPLLPNFLLFIVLGGAANVDIVWDGIVIGAERKDIWLNLGNSLEFTVYYAAFLFLPRLGRKRKASNE